jgi:hypothetical protein
MNATALPVTNDGYEDWYPMFMDPDSRSTDELDDADLASIRLHNTSLNGKPITMTEIMDLMDQPKVVVPDNSDYDLALRRADNLPAISVQACHLIRAASYAATCVLGWHDSKEVAIDSGWRTVQSVANFKKSDVIKAFDVILAKGFSFQQTLNIGSMALRSFHNTYDKDFMCKSEHGKVDPFLSIILMALALLFVAVAAGLGNATLPIPDVFGPSVQGYQAVCNLVQLFCK